MPTPADNEQDEEETFLLLSKRRERRFVKLLNGLKSTILLSFNSKRTKLCGNVPIGVLDA